MKKEKIPPTLVGGAFFFDVLYSERESEGYGAYGQVCWFVGEQSVHRGKQGKKHAYKKYSK